MFIFPRKTSAMISCRSSLDVCMRQTTIGSGEAAVVWTNNSCTRIQIKWHCELLLFCRIAVYMLSLSNQLWRYRIWRDKCNSTGLFACTWLPSYPPLAVWFILLLLSLNIANIFCNLCAHLRYKNFCCFIIRRECRIQAQKTYFIVTEMKQIDHFYSLDLLLHMKKGDPCFWSPILNQGVTKNIHRN